MTKTSKVYPGSAGKTKLVGKSYESTPVVRGFTETKYTCCKRVWTYRGPVTSPPLCPRCGQRGEL